MITADAPDVQNFRARYGSSCGRCHRWINVGEMMTRLVWSPTSTSPWMHPECADRARAVLEEQTEEELAHAERGAEIERELAGWPVQPVELARRVEVLMRDAVDRAIERAALLHPAEAELLELAGAEVKGEIGEAIRERFDEVTTTQRRGE